MNNKVYNGEEFLDDYMKIFEFIEHIGGDAICEIYPTRIEYLTIESDRCSYHTYVSYEEIGWEDFYNWLNGDNDE